MLEFCTLGTGGTLPLADRALSSLYLRHNGQALLIDCGEGTQVQIRKLGWGFRCIDGLLLTHFHGDHCTGIAGLLLSLDKAGRTETFHIWGPTGLKRVVDGLCVIVPGLSYQVLLHEIPVGGVDLEIIGLKIRAFPVDHGGIPCFGYRIFLPRAGAFDRQRAENLKIPVRDWGRLQKGENVRAGLRKITPDMVMGPERKGITLLFATDTRPCETLYRYGKDTDLMILEGMYGTDDKLPQALKNHHMLFEEAAVIARDCGTENLLLTHFSTSLDNPEEALPTARAVFERTWAAYDVMTVTMKYPKDREAAWISLC